MIGIYKIVNDVNDKIYIGQSTNIEKRWTQHIYDATHFDHCHMTIDFDMGKKGIEHFKYEVVEQCLPEELDEKEIYWISQYDSFNNGYNCTIGGKALHGEDHPRAFLTDQDVWSIRELYANHIPFREAFKQYEHTGITKRGFKKIWLCENWSHIHTDVYTDENKEWHKTFGVGHSEDQVGTSSLDRAIKQEEIDSICADYRNGMPIMQLVKKYKRDYGCIEKYLTNPVEVKKIKYKGREVQNLETGLIFSSISKAAKWASCGSTTLTRHLYDNKTAGKVPETGEPAHWKEL